MHQTIYIGADHAGFVMKESLKAKLETKGYTVEDLGAHELNPKDDYPEYAAEVAHAVTNHKGSLGILSCGNAEGVCIAANKFDGVRAGVGFSTDSAKTMREDDNANIICIPGRIETIDDPVEIVLMFLRTPFSQAARHKRRLAKLKHLEQQPIEIVPTILVQNLDTFKERISNAELRKLAPIWQVDILNNTLVDQQTYFDAQKIAQLKPLPEFELHLMIENPIPVIEEWKHHTDSVTRAIIHAEIQEPLEKTLVYIKNLGIETGLALNPDTSIKVIKPVAHLLDSILVMGVNPGATGQSFLGKKILKKIKKLNKKYPNITIAVDGGVNQETIDTIVKSGAQRVSVGSAIWGAKNPVNAFNSLSTESL